MGYDVIIVGGGLGGSALATVLRRRDISVLVLEREKKFKDRVRGETMHPWGVAIAHRLGLLDHLLAAGAHQTTFWMTYVFGHVTEKRNLRETTPYGQCSLNIYHPALQTALLDRAERAGADVRRGAIVERIDLTNADAPTVTYVADGVRETETARLVVGADGRNSNMRAWGGFEERRDADLLTIAGTLLEGTSVPDDSVHMAFGPGFASLLAPLGNKRARAYFMYPGVAGRRHLAGKERTSDFVQLCRDSGAPAQWFEGIDVTGPLAEFEGADHWVDTPGKPGIALIGDAAGATDPSWGCGLSLTLADVENLAECLGSTDDWKDAAQRYAKRRDDYYATLHRMLGWMTQLMWTPGPIAQERRQRVFARIHVDPRGFPDPVGQGPYGPNDERARRLILGEET